MIKLVLNLLVCAVIHGQSPSAFSCEFSAVCTAILSAIQSNAGPEVIDDPVR